MPVDQPDRAPAATPLGEQLSAMRRVLAPIHPAGWPFIAAFAAATVGLSFVAQPLGWIGAVLTAWCVFFFRDPRRVVPTRPGLVVSAADGLVQGIVVAPPPPELGLDPTPLTRVSVFLNVFDVHVNRAPADGVIEQVIYRPGKFFNASLDKASDHNERMAVSMRLADGRRLVFVQIAGLVARRIVCTLRPGQAVRAGERFGMIRFGSRVDLYLPEGAAPLVALGQRMVAGESVVADLASDEPARPAEAR